MFARSDDKATFKPTQQQAPAQPIRPDLIAAQRTHAIIDIQAEGSNAVYQSVILRVDIGAKRIVIEDLFPQGFVSWRGQPVTVTLRLAGNQRTRFTTQVREQITVANEIQYHLALPADMTYNQRRETYRFRLPQTTPATSEFIAPGQFFCSGVVQDISLSGVRLTLNHRVPLREGDTLDQFNFEFEGLSFHCRGDVRNVHNDTSGQVSVGVKFLGMPRPLQRSLEKILAQQHRQLARQAGNIQTRMPVAQRARAPEATYL